MARAMATLLPLNGFTVSLISWIHMPAIGLSEQVGTYRGSVGKPPPRGMIPRIGRNGIAGVLAASSLASHAAAVPCSEDASVEHSVDASWS
jgi:hypothetical protein